MLHLEKWKCSVTQERRASLRRREEGKPRKMRKGKEKGDLVRGMKDVLKWIYGDGYITW